MRAAVVRALALTALAGLAAAAACRPSTPPLTPLVIATGGEGGVYRALGEAFAATLHDRWGVHATVLTTAASIENLRLLRVGKADLAFTTVDSADLAMRGQPPFSTAVRISALAGLYDDYLQIVVRAGASISTVQDLRGRRVSTGAAGSGTEIVADRVLHAAGLGGEGAIVRSRLSASASGEALRAGRIDAFFFTGGLPTPAIAELARTVRVRLLSVGSIAADLQRTYGEVYLARSIPAATYGMEHEVPTLAIPNVLVVRSDMPVAEAREVTALLFASKARLEEVHAQARRLDRRAALATFPVPLHPGAARYFRETKVWVSGR
ncbi:TAXI family TRAP transporter solute-binding subunit [Actinoallomurus sp. CA-150999]|uniref:TAXI family TRAP transporter solute-binding subunit n=1 Tax=Actinoallomurus sp. CA-150999 TaxID=3239887 RepID=UPI003D8B8358